MKVDKYRAERSELVSLKMNDIVLLACYRKRRLPVLWWIQTHRKDQQEYVRYNTAMQV